MFYSKYFNQLSWQVEVQLAAGWANAGTALPVAMLNEFSCG